MKVLYTQGSKNYFLLIDEYENLFNIDRSKFTKWICENFVQLDGTLFLQKYQLPECKGKMIMYNPDGSEAEMCGNGIRIVARKLYERIGIKNFYIETKKGKIKIEKVNNGCLEIFKANINPVELNKKVIPINFNINKDEFIDINMSFFDYNVNAIRVQNPHIVFIVDEFDIKKINYYGKWVANNKNIFPEGINLNFVKIIDKNKIFVITYERGAGITNSCGTGMSSSSYICAKLGYCDFNVPIEVYNKGGKVKCIANSNSVDLIGNATYEKEIIITPFEKCEINTNFEKEKKCYQSYINEIKKELPKDLVSFIVD